MDKYYHFTSLNNFYSIMQNGLIPQNGFRCNSIGDDKYGVFLSKGMDNSIIMYALMIRFYEKYIGEAGNILIEENKLRIKELETMDKRSWQIPAIEHDIKILNEQIDRVMQIRNCGSFTNYLGGNGCFLSISGLNNIDDNNPSDCCYNDKIDPDKISIVYLKNRYTNEYVCSSEAVLSYFMSLYPIEYILKNVENENQDIIYWLYKCKSETYLTYFNPDYYDLVEIPIRCYDYNNQKSKNV